MCERCHPDTISKQGNAGIAQPIHPAIIGSVCVREGPGLAATKSFSHWISDSGYACVSVGGGGFPSLPGVYNKTVVVIRAYDVSETVTMSSFVTQ